MGGLWLISNSRTARHPLPETLHAVFSRGFKGVMVREKHLSGRELYELAASAAAVARPYRAGVVINDRADVALALEGAGFHTGQQGLPASEARGLLGSDRILGYSAHHADEAAAALSQGADYVALSPVFPSITKPDYPPQGPEWLEAALNRVPGERVMALGGVQAATVGRLPRTVAGAFVMGAILQSPDPADAAQALVTAWERR